MAAVLVAALVVVPLVEIYLLLQVGQLLGTLPTVGLLVLMSVIGGLLLRSEGARTWRAFRGALAAGRVPGREVADGALVIFGGALMLTPGFATDVLGLVCVFPLTRPALRRLLTGFVTARLGLVGVAGSAASGAARARRRTGRPSGERPAAGRSGSARPGSGSPGGVVDGEVLGDPPSEPPRR